MTPKPRYSFLPVLLGAAATVFLLLAACSGAPSRDDAPESGATLKSSLSVAAAALAAGQPDVARRLYLSLAGRFEHAPEPMLGLGYIALHSGDLAAAEQHFLEAAERARRAPEARAEALLGAGRIALAQKRPQAAREHFERARITGPDTPSAPWIANGLAVAAAVDTDFATAEAMYAEALRLSPEDPRITANRVRMLVETGRIEDAAHAHAQRSASYWADDDGRILLYLIEDARREQRRQAGAGAALDPSCTAPGGTGPVASVRDPASQLVLRLSAFDRPAASRTPGSVSFGRDPPTRGSGLMLHLTDLSGPRTPPPSPDCSVASSVSSLASRSSATSGGQDRPASALGEGPSPGAAGPEASPGEAALTLHVGQSEDLRLAKRATSVVAAAPQIADVQLSSPNLLHVIGTGVGRTSISVVDNEGFETRMVVRVIPDLELLRSELAGEPGLESVEVRHIARGVSLSGEVESPREVERALLLAGTVLPEGVELENNLQVTTPQQVNLEVQLAEVSRSVTEDLGVNWESFGAKDSERFGFRVGRWLPVAVGEGFGLDAFPPSAVAGGETASTLFFGSRGPLGQFRVMIDALANAGLANVLARPNVTAISGESASFFSGGEYPLPTGFEDGVIIFEYKKYGVLLDFVPTVVDADRIVLTVRPEVSEPSLNRSVQVVGLDIPVINVRRAETTVEVGDGESIVIAGLFRNATNTVESGVTGLKDAPVLGTLFGHTSVRADELELIVIVTARLVRSSPAPGAEDAPPPTASRRVNGYHY